VIAIAAAAAVVDLCWTRKDLADFDDDVGPPATELMLGNANLGTR
jgi:hypothetical protein